jgi:hypothetical protein
MTRTHHSHSRSGWIRLLVVAALAPSLTLTACGSGAAQAERALPQPKSAAATPALTYRVIIEGPGIHAVATADAVLGPPGTGVLSAPAATRTATPAGGRIRAGHRGRVFVLRNVRAGDSQILRWYASAAQGPESARATVTISVRNSEGHVIATHDLHRAIPTKITGPSFSAGSSEIAIEEIEIAEEGLAMPCDESDIDCH